MRGGTRLSVAQRLDSAAPPPARLAAHARQRMPLLFRPPLLPSGGGASPLFPSARPRVTREMPAQMASRPANLWTTREGDDGEGERERATATTTPPTPTTPRPPPPPPPPQRSVSSPSCPSTARPRAGNRKKRETWFYGERILHSFSRNQAQKISYQPLLKNSKQLLRRRSSPAAAAPPQPPLLLPLLLRRPSPRTSSPSCPTQRQSWDGRSSTRRQGKRSELSGE